MTNLHRRSVLGTTLLAAALSLPHAACTDAPDDAPDDAPPARSTLVAVDLCPGGRVNAAVLDPVAPQTFVICSGTAGESLVHIDETTGERVAYPTFASGTYARIAIHGGRLFIARDQNLYALDLEAPPGTIPQRLVNPAATAATANTFAVTPYDAYLIGRTDAGPTLERVSLTGTDQTPSRVGMLGDSAFLHAVGESLYARRNNSLYRIDVERSQGPDAILPESPVLLRQDAVAFDIVDLTNQLLISYTRPGSGFQPTEFVTVQGSEYRGWTPPCTIASVGGAVASGDRVVIRSNEGTCAQHLVIIEPTTNDLLSYFGVSGSTLVGARDHEIYMLRDDGTGRQNLVRLLAEPLAPEAP